MAHTFILSDESLNRYGYRVLTAGIALAAFKKNPVMLYGHNTWRPPIGRWENLRVENGKLLADAVFDKEDEEAKKLEAKVEQGIIKAVSIGFRVLEHSEENVVRGQRRPTVTKAELYEASLVTVPGNPGAVKLEFPDEGLTLSGDYKEERLDAVLPPLPKQKNEPKPNTEMELKELNKKLGLPENTDAEGIAAAFEAQKLRADESAQNIVDLGKKLGYVTEDNEKAIRKLAESDTGLAIDLFGAKANQEEKLDNEETEEQTQETKGERLSEAVKELAAKKEKGEKKEQEPKEPKVEHLTFDQVLGDIAKANEY